MPETPLPAPNVCAEVSYGPEGQEFESLTACQIAPESADSGAIFTLSGTFWMVFVQIDPYRDPYGNGSG